MNIQASFPEINSTEHNEKSQKSKPLMPHTFGE
jgi:hypothetical protein